MRTTICVKMKAKRRRAYVIVALVGTLALLLHGKDAMLRSFNVTLWTQSFPAEPVKNTDDNVVAESTHPSVFQQWKAHQPRRESHEVFQDCAQFKQFNIQVRCSRRLQNLKDFCSTLEGYDEKDQNYKDKEGGDSESGSEDDKNDVIKNTVVDVFHYRQGRTVVMYCSVHKVASTFWVRLFRFLHNDTNSRPVSTPEGISKYTVHLTPFHQSRPLALAYVTRKLHPQDKEFRFMFTRNPYRRLWSVYIDKFVLPDHFFWSYHGLVIKDQTSNNSRRQKRKSLNMCPEVSFEEFVRYSVQSQSYPRAHRDDHILPVYATCNPCAFDPNFIGRVENMEEDSEAVLGILNLQYLNQQKDFQHRILSQIRTVTDFVYDTVIERGNLRNCVSDDQLQSRLLKAFVLKGYLSPEVLQERSPVVISQSSPTSLFNMMKQLFLSSNRTQRQVSRQSKRFFLEAYRTLPRDLLLEVRDYYWEDFDSFGYDPEPIELFGGGQSNQREVTSVESDTKSDA